MDIGGVRLAPVAASFPAANRVEPTASGTRAVATELPKDEAVRSVADLDVRVDIRQEKARDQAQREQLLRAFIQNRNVIDPRSRELVFKAVDTRTGEIVRQFPDEARLRLREYLGQMRTIDAAGARPDARLTRSA